MRQVWENPEFAAELGARARDDVGANLSVAAAGQRMALIILPRFSASSRKGTKFFMQASDAPPDGGAGPRSNAVPVIGAAPVEGNGEGAPTDAEGAAPFTGGNGDAFAGPAHKPDRRGWDR